ncbi:MAG: hypothetical protein K2X42_09285 [Burkholderiaceae bacterium]|nr:hypothetical protein [Burkholderiaceae bacterium]
MDLLRCCTLLSAILELVMICVAPVFISPTMGSAGLNPVPHPTGRCLQVLTAWLSDAPERRAAMTRTPAQTDGGWARLEA